MVGQRNPGLLGLMQMSQQLSEDLPELVQVRFPKLIEELKRMNDHFDKISPMLEDMGRYVEMAEDAQKDMHTLFDKLDRLIEVLEPLKNLEAVLIGNTGDDEEA